MIHVERQSAPPSLDSPLMREERMKMTKFFSRPAEERRQKRYKFFPISTQLKDIRPALYQTFRGKCAFCESRVKDGSFMFLDRFRPRTEAIGLDGSVSPDHYWWLAYEWFNLYLVCSACNKFKGNRFPVEERKRAEFGRALHVGADAEKLLEERPLLLDPCHDYPEEQLLFDERGMVASDTKRGRVTIEVLNLNRTPLAADRAAALEGLRAQWDAVFSRRKTRPGQLTSEFFRAFDDPALPFLAMRRQFLQQWSRELAHTRPGLRRRLEPFLSYRTALTERAQAARPRAEQAIMKKTFKSFESFQSRQEKYSVAEESGIEHYYIRTRLIERIEISNFKVIDKLSLAIPLSTRRQGSWLLLLGENGTGKSTILQAAALALMGEEHRRRLGLDASEFVRYGCQSGYVKVFLTGSADPITLQFTKRSRLFRVTPKEPRVLLLGYGATRLLPREKGTNARRKKVGSHAAKADNLFNPFTPLNDAVEWLCRMPEEDFDRIARGLKVLLLLRDDESLIRECRGRSNVMVKAFRSRVALGDLSDGYQSVVALTSDIMSVMRLRWPSMAAAEGIVLIDEIDAHMHPTWKMWIVERLRRTFPRLQFIVTSHDPLTLRGLDAGEVVVMRRDARGHPVALTDLPSPKGLRVDQLLTSEFFGLNSTVDPELHRLFEKYYELLAKKRLTERERRMLDKLKAQLDSRRQLGTTRRERLMLEAADEFLAQHDLMEDGEERRLLKRETKRKIADMWKSVKPLGV